MTAARAAPSRRDPNIAKLTYTLLDISAYMNIFIYDDDDDDDDDGINHQQNHCNVFSI